MADDKTRDGGPAADAGTPPAATDTAPAKRTRKAAPAPEPVARAGGYVDRGDGNGWVLED